MNAKKKTIPFHRIIDTSIDIEAKPEVIWKVLLDNESWKSWNPFIPYLEGNMVKGERLIIKVTPPGLKPMTFKPKVFEVKTNEKILWGGSFMWVLYRGDHALLLEAVSETKTRFRQIERFRGPMALFLKGMVKKTEKGYLQMNLALKEFVEQNYVDK